MQLQIQYGLVTGSINIDSGKLIENRRTQLPRAVKDLHGLVNDALASPIEFPPLSRALTPDDDIAIVVDDELLQADHLVRSIIAYLSGAGIKPGKITVVSQAGADRPDFEMAWPGSQFEKHDPADKDRMAYLATTKKGQRIYMNRAVADADQLIVVAQSRFGLSPVRWLYPLLSDHPLQSPSDHSSDEEAKEVCWLLGLPFFVQVIPGPGDSVAQIMAGPADSFAQIKSQLGDLWRMTLDRQSDITLAAISGSAESATSTDLARALHNAARITSPQGTIILMVQGRPPLDAGFELIRDSKSVPAAMKKSSSHIAANHWMNVVKNFRVYVKSDWPDELVEELFATPLQSMSQIQKLIDEGGDVAYLPDAHRSRAEVANQ
jgi:hypothetical protein